MRRFYLNNAIVICLLISSLIFIGKATAQDSPVNHVYQYSAKAEGNEAYLWIPPDCKYVRGVIIAMSNMLERKWLESAIIRKTASKEGLGIIWINLSNSALGNEPELNADMTKGSGVVLENLLKQLADISGYKEIAYAPIISTGHSAHGQFAWTAANWNPKRIIAAIPIKTVPLPGTLAFKDIPLCYMVGQTTEWPEFRDGRPGDRDFFWPVVRQSAIALRNKNEHNLIGVVVDPGGGHFDWSDHLARFLALYIQKACQYRLPKRNPHKGPVRLKKIDPESGWLTDTGGMEDDTNAPAPYKRYKGNPRDAYWWFDGETARAAAAFEGDRKSRKKQMLTFIQDGTLLPVAKTGFASLKFEPEKDGITFHVIGGFLPSVPKELIHAGEKLGHAEGPIRFYVITGPAVQIDSNTFRIQFDRGGPGPVWIEESQKGNKEYRHAVQPAKMDIPEKIIKGPSQTIIFPQIHDQEVGAKYIVLGATADSKLPVHYYVDSGPAFVKKDTLVFTPVPVKSKYPVKVTVVAYQWGRTIPPLYQSAGSVTREFYIKK
jgi:hypothetical protein